MALTKVSTDGVKDDAITSGKIPANAVGASELATDSVGYSELAVNAVGNENISAGSISSGKMASDSVSTAAIQDQAVTAAKLASGVQTTINNNADNRVITGSGTANTLNAESGVVIDSDVKVGIGNTSPTNTFDGAGLKIEKYQQRNTSYASPDGYYGASLGEVTNSTTKVWATVESHYAQASAVSAGLFLKAFHQDAGGSQAGFTIKNLKSGNDLTFSRVTTATNTGSPAVETERLRILHNGGITFNGDTAAANALDDYEEGTWTPALNSGNSLAESTGRYVKIGKMVYAFWEITLPTTSQSAHLIINNLPFTSTNTLPSSGGSAKDYQTYDIQDGPIYHITRNNTQVQFYKNSGQNFVESNGSGLNFRACSIYQAAS